jgi:hypothetical protein
MAQEAAGKLHPKVRCFVLDPRSKFSDAVDDEVNIGLKRQG